MEQYARPMAVPPDLSKAYAALTADLQGVFGPRLQAAVAFGPRIRSADTTPAGGRRAAGHAQAGDTLVLVDRVTLADLEACARHADAWERAGLHTPLILGRDEFLRSLDAFPLEYDDIIAHHVPLAGDDPFTGLAVRPDDLRRAIETRAKGHLVHLREGYLEARGRADGLADLILASAPPFSALLGNLDRLIGGTPAGTEARARAVAEKIGIPQATLTRLLQLEGEDSLGGDEAVTLYREYLALVERLVAWVDAWSRT